MFAMSSAHALHELVWPRAHVRDDLYPFSSELQYSVPGSLYGSTMHVATL